MESNLKSKDSSSIENDLSDSSFSENSILKNKYSKFNEIFFL